MGADPCPASFENNPRLTPQFKVTRRTPMPVPATPAVGLNASRKIRANVGTTAPAFIRMMRRAPKT